MKWNKLKGCGTKSWRLLFRWSSPWWPTFLPREISGSTVYDWNTNTECRHTPVILHVSRSSNEVGLRHYELQKSVYKTREEHYLPESEVHRSRLQYNLRSSKAMYVSQDHDIWNWTSIAWELRRAWCHLMLSISPEFDVLCRHVADGV